ncbi:MAG: hypothetical protein SVX43_05405 [Cyanobacteriota bacterium]|nr:hypothetical protein [Cyanobacteriota bacterium]
MNLKAIALAALLGVSGPAIADLTRNLPAAAQFNAPLATFDDGEWSVTIDYYNNAYTYFGRNMRTGSTLTLRGASVTGTPQRRLYTWRNGDYTYQVAWRPNDPRFVRLQVFDPRGQEVLNRLLRQGNAYD